MIASREWVRQLTPDELKVFMRNVEKAPLIEDEESFYSWWQFAETEEVMALLPTIRKRIEPEALGSVGEAEEVG